MKTTEGKFKFRFLGRSPNKREVNIPLPLTRLKDYVQERFRSNPGYQTTKAQDKKKRRVFRHRYRQRRTTIRRRQPNQQGSAVKIAGFTSD